MTPPDETSTEKWIRARRRLRVPNALLPVPADLDRDDPVGQLIIRSIAIVLGFLIIVGGGVGLAIWMASGARTAATVGVTNGQRSACIGDLRNIESKAQGEVNDAVLFRLAVLDGRDPASGETITDRAERDRLADLYVRQGLDAHERRELAAAALEQPALNGRCGKPAT